MDDHGASEPASSPWERHRDEQLRARLRLSYAERLRWLEQAKRFARLALEAAKQRQRDGD